MSLIGLFFGIVFGLGGYIVARALFGFYTVGPNERAVLTSFGKARRITDKTTLDDPISDDLDDSERDRYNYPQVEVIQPGGPYFRWPWQKVHKVSIAISTASIAWDPEDISANQDGMILEAVTRDQLNTGITGQIRFSICERNLYAFIFGVKNPIAHVMGYFVSVLRERIATFDAPPDPLAAPSPEPAATELKLEGISINDLRKNLNLINDQMDAECRSSAARYGVALDSSLITSIDPPPDIESALAAINTAHNEVSSDISIAQALADQRIVESKRAVEIQTMNAEAEVQPLQRLSDQLRQLKSTGENVIPGYLRNVRLALFRQARRIILETEK